MEKKKVDTSGWEAKDCYKRPDVKPNEDLKQLKKEIQVIIILSTNCGNENLFLVFL